MRALRRAVRPDGARALRPRATLLVRLALTFGFPLAAGALFAVAPAAAHQIMPASMTLRPGGRNDVVVSDTQCFANMTISSPVPSVVQVFAVDPVTGQLSGNGQSASLNNLMTGTFAVIGFAPVQSPTIITLSVTETDLPPCTGSTSRTIPVTLRPHPRSDGAAPAATDAADPINTGSGELYLPPETLLDLFGPIDFDFSYYYASRLQFEGVTGTMGPGWRHSFEWKLAKMGANIEITTPLGRIIRFEKIFGDTSWRLTPYRDIPFQLVENAFGQFVLNDPRDEKMYTFDAIGRLVLIDDGRGNALTVTNDGFRVTQVADGLGRVLTLGYTGSSLTSASDGARTVTFARDGSSRIVSMTDPLGGVTTYAYHPTIVELLTAKTEPRGNTRTTQVFDATRRVTSQTDALANTITLSYPGGGVTAVTDPFGNTRQHMYGIDVGLDAAQDEANQTASFVNDASGRRERITDKLGNVTSWTHHAPSGRVATITHADGAATAYNYAPRVEGGVTHHDLASVTRADGAIESFTYDADGNVLTRIDGVSGVSSYTYNARGQALTATSPEGGVTSFAYNANATLASATDPSGNTTSFAYDALRRPVQMTHADGSMSTLAYDALDRVTSSTDALGNATSYAYDANGNLTAWTRPTGRTWSIAHDAMDRATSVADPLGNTSNFAYDAIGRLATATDANGNTTARSYDAVGRLASLSDGAGNAWSQTHTAEGVVASRTNPLGATASFVSDAMGRHTRATSPLGNSVDIEYDAMGRVARTTDPLGREAQIDRDGRGLVTQLSVGGLSASYALDGLGLVAAVTDPRGSVWARGFDAQGRRTSQGDPLGNTWLFQYDNRSRLSQTTLPGGLGTATYAYDAAGRNVARTYSDGTSLQFAYDADGWLTSATDAGGGAGGSLTIAYDAGGRLVDCNGLAMTYDAGGRLTSMTLAPGKTVSYAYDARDLVTSVTDWVGGATTFSYDAAGRPASLIRPNGITTTYVYDADDRLVGITEGSVSSIALTRDARGQITAATRNVPLAATPAAADLAASFNAACEVDGSTYDAMGRLTTDGARSFEWDLASRLESYTDGGTTVAFDHDALGNIVSRAEGGETRELVWNYALDLPSVNVVRDGSGAAKAAANDLCYYVTTPDGSLLHGIEAASGARRFYHCDEMWSTIFLTDDAGAVTDSYAYTPHGELIAQTGSTDNPLKFHGRTGVMTEGDICLMRARQYDPARGRFISRDPMEALGPRSINPYQAFLGNPLLYVDPRGTDEERVDEGPGMIVRFKLWLRSWWFSEEIEEARERNREESDAFDKRVQERMELEKARCAAEEEKRKSEERAAQRREEEEEDGGWCSRCDQPSHDCDCMGPGLQVTPDPFPPSLPAPESQWQNQIELRSLPFMTLPQQKQAPIEQSSCPMDSPMPIGNCSAPSDGWEPCGGTESTTCYSAQPEESPLNQIDGFVRQLLNGTGSAVPSARGIPHWLDALVDGR